MTHLVFHEKPGCGGNARQRAALLAAGHTLEVRSLLAEPWTAETLLAYLQALPVAEWFNRAAPRVKSGELQPESLGGEQALALLLAEPLLIRRPLMRNTADGSHFVGFDAEAVAAWIGLDPIAPTAPTAREGCAAPAEVCATPHTTHSTAPGARHAPL